MKDSAIKKLSLLIVISFTFALLTTFQNCGGQFKVDTVGSLDLASLKLIDPLITFSTPEDLINTNNFKITFSVEGVDEGDISLIQCQLNSEAPAICTNREFNIVNLVDGDHQVKVTTTDVQGKTKSFTKVFRKDSTVPTVILAMAPPSLTNQTNAQLIFSANDNLSGVDKIECSVDQGAFAVCVSPLALAGPLTAGTHSVQIRALDRAGNISLLTTHNWTIDLTVPTVTISVNPQPVTNQTTAQFIFSGAGIVTYECQLDAAAFAACVSPINFNALAAGNHSFKVRGTNAAGTTSAETTFLWMVDLTPPTTPVITTDTLAATRLSTATFNFASVDANGILRYECALDNGAFANCTSPHALQNLIEGARTFKVKSFDNAGNASVEATFLWTIDTTPPVLSWVQVPTKIQTFPASSNFTFQSVDSLTTTFNCSYENPTKAIGSVNCANRSFTLNNLSPEAYITRVIATDAAGNSSTLFYGWDVDNGLGAFERFKMMDSHIRGSCGITLDNQIKCWGNGGAKFQLIGGSQNSTKVLMGWNHLCALNQTGEVRCMGLSETSLRPTIKVSGARDISVGDNFACAVMANNGSVKCWGASAENQLGNNSTNGGYSETAVDVVGLTGVKQIASNIYSTCVIKSDDKLACWGGTNSPIPINITTPFTKAIRSISLSYFDFCAIDIDNLILCGLAPNNGSINLSPVAGLPLALNTHLTSDSGSRCAVTPERKVACWGSASAISRGLGNIFGFLISSATLVPDLENVQFVTSGRMSSCAVMENSTVKCWGEFSAISESLTSLSGVIFPELQGMQSLSWDPFTALACSLMNNLTVSCWGRGTALIFQNDSALPAQNPYSLGAKFLSGSCMINSTNQVACWDSYSSQVRMIAGISNATTIASNRTGGCGIVANGDVYCWGFNSYGNLGNNTTVASTAAIKVNNIANAVHVAYNVSATCVILNGGNVKCWGSQFGLVPTDVPSLNGSTALSVSNIGVCGVNGIDTVKCLQAFRADAPVVNIANTTGAISISNGVHHSCSKLSNGQIACWGVNSYGQLGNLPLYTEYDSNAPTKVSAVIIPTSKPVREVYADLYATVLSHTDGTVTKFGQKVPFVYRPSAILKSY